MKKYMVILLLSLSLTSVAQKSPEYLYIAENFSDIKSNIDRISFNDQQANLQAASFLQIISDEFNVGVSEKAFTAAINVARNTELEAIDYILVRKILIKYKEDQK